MLHMSLIDVSFVTVGEQLCSKTSGRITKEQVGHWRTNAPRFVYQHP